MQKAAQKDSLCLSLILLYAVSGFGIYDLKQTSPSAAFYTYASTLLFQYFSGEIQSYA